MVEFNGRHLFLWSNSTDGYGRIQRTVMVEFNGRLWSNSTDGYGRIQRTSFFFGIGSSMYIYMYVTYFSQAVCEPHLNIACPKKQNIYSFSS
jgi:hypothetical protein